MKHIIRELGALALCVVPVFGCVQAKAQATDEASPVALSTAVAVTNSAGNLQWYRPATNFDGSVAGWVEADVPAVNSASETVGATAASPAGLISQSQFSAQTATVISDPLINVNFSYNAQTPKTGFAAVGISDSDFWNSFPNTADATMGLSWYEGSPSGVTLRVQNAPGSWYNTTGDSMYDSYVYRSPGLGNITVTIANLPSTAPWSYDIYIYGHGAADNQNGIYTLNGVTKSTAQGAYWNNNQLATGNFIENIHYVKYSVITPPVNGQAVITVTPDAGGYPLINGIQIVLHPPTIYTTSAQVVGDYRSPSEYNVVDGSTSIDVIPQASYDACNTILTAHEYRDFPASILWFKPYWDYYAGGWGVSDANYIPMMGFWTTYAAYASNPNLYSLPPITLYNYGWILYAHGIDTF
jgi:hypothetical protein